MIRGQISADVDRGDCQAAGRRTPPCLHDGDRLLGCGHESTYSDEADIIKGDYVY